MKKTTQNLRYLFLFILLLVTVILAINFYVLLFSKSNIYYSVSDLEKYQVGLVLGASVKSSGEPSDVLKDRLDAAVEAYEAGKIKNIIVSGDNSITNYNEPQAMEKYLIKSGIKEKYIYKDYAGFDTYDSIYRAKEIFGVEDLVILTQEYHLKRALYISKKLGIDSVGFAADKRPYLNIGYFEFREIFSRIKAFLEADLLKTKTKYDKDIKIQIK